MKCEIQWIDKNGDPTPDQNVAVGKTWCEAHVVEIEGRFVPQPRSRDYNICAVHAERLSEPGMHHWRFLALPKPETCPRCGTSGIASGPGSYHSQHCCVDLATMRSADNHSSDVEPMVTILESKS
jgi:hypothetical protein